MEGVCRARPHDDEPSVVRSRVTVYHELYSVVLFSRLRFFRQDDMIGCGLWCECVKLFTVVNLNQNSRRQDARTAGHVGFCAGPNRHVPIRRAIAPPRLNNIIRR